MTLGHFNKASSEGIAQRHGFSIESATSTFPIDIFLLMGDDYISEKTLGPNIHSKIMKFENAVLNSNKKNLLEDMYKKFYEIGIGRQLEIIASKRI